MKNVAVTGGSSGIGFACAQAYAARGANIALIARDGAKLAQAKKSLEGEYKGTVGRVLIISADLSSFDATKAAFEALRAVEQFEVDILINSAGVIIPGEFVSMTMEDFTSNMDSGFWTVANPCKAIAPRMVERGSGHIVNVSSVAGYMGVYGYTGYSAAKFASFGFTEALRCEMKPAGVGVSIVCPPDTKTPGLAREKKLRPPETEAISGSLKPVEPEVIARAVVAGVDKGRYLIIPGFISKFYFRLKGILPEIAFAVMDSDVRKLRKKQKSLRS